MSRFTRTTFIALSALIIVSAAVAHEGATGVVLQRMELMKSIANETKALAEVITGKVAFSSDTVARSAQALAAHAAEITDFFPAGSDHHPSKANDLIWTDWPGFERDAKALREHALALEKGAGTADRPEALMPLFRSVAETCQSCHETFRTN